jgi:hypothetical protein
MFHKEIENPMVIDRHWKHHGKESQVVGECAGCEEDIYAHEQWMEMELHGHSYQMHQDTDCCYQWVSGISRFRGGEE